MANQSSDPSHLMLNLPRRRQVVIPHGHRHPPGDVGDLVKTMGGRDDPLVGDEGRAAFVEDNSSFPLGEGDLPGPLARGRNVAADDLAGLGELLPAYVFVGGVLKVRGCDDWYLRISLKWH